MTTNSTDAGGPQVIEREIHVPLHAVYDSRGHLVAAFVDPAQARAFAESL